MRRAIAFDPNNKNRGKGRRRGKVSVDIDSANLTGSLTFYNTPEPPDNGYIIVSDSNTIKGIAEASAKPVFWTADDSTIVSTVNGLPGNTSTFTTTAQAFSYLASSGDYYVLSSNSKRTPTDKLIFEVDARRVSSYPTTGNTWYDISPSNNHMSYLYNNSNIEYEDATKSMYRNVRQTQADHYRSTNTYDLDGDFTMIVLAKVYQCHNGTANGLLTNHSHAHNTGAGITVKTVTNDADFRISCNTGNGSNRTYHTYYGTSNIKDRWSHLMVHYSGTTLSLWVNGIKEYTRSYSMASRSDYIDLFNWSTTYAHNSNYRPKCKIQYGQVYEKALTNAEISQSYHQGDIITDGLTLALDASNLVSYESGSSVAYSLIGNDTGSLTNGLGYNSNNGGTFEFDGTNDYIAIDNLGLSSHTIEGWFNSADGSQGGSDYSTICSIFGNYDGGSAKYTYIGLIPNLTFRIDDGATSHAGIATVSYTANTWYYVALTYDATSGIAIAYVNGTQVGSRNSTTNITFNSIPHNIGKTQPNTYFDGQVASHKTYNRALSSNEIMQNFIAQRGIFSL